MIYNIEKPFQKLLQKVDGVITAVVRQKDVVCI